MMLSRTGWGETSLPVAFQTVEGRRAPWGCAAGAPYRGTASPPPPPPPVCVCVRARACVCMCVCVRACVRACVRTAGSEWHHDVTSNQTCKYVRGGANSHPLVSGHKPSRGGSRKRGLDGNRRQKARPGPAQDRSHLSKELNPPFHQLLQPTDPKPLELLYGSCLWVGVDFPLTP